MDVKAGDEVTLKFMPDDYEFPLLAELRLKGTKVKPKAPGTRGQWFCIDCGACPQNNWQAQTHVEESPKHRMAWRNFETGDVEVP
jgi:hypothetical protein